MRGLTFRGFIVTLAFTPCILTASSVMKFEPLAHTLSRYSISKIPEPADYPGIPAITLLSLQEYRQFETRHERRFHKIIKILTPSGKDYTTIKIPCFTACHMEARTIKPDGKVIPLPGRDVVRTEKLTGYQAPYFLAQFALPAVEAGDIIEYAGTIEYPYPLYFDDFRFGDTLPALKAIFLLSHPPDFSYSYLRISPPGSPQIRSSRDTFVEGQTSFTRTTFIVDNAPAIFANPEPAEIRQSQPGVRLLIESKNGTRFEEFRDWFHYAAFISRKAASVPAVSSSLRDLLSKATEKGSDPKGMLRFLYHETDGRIQIVTETLPESGFAFQDSEQILRNGIAAPHDFALLLANRYRALKWECDLLLVNSRDQPEAAANAPFPLDLDMVLLNVKTPAGEFLIDCNQNGMPPEVLSSKIIHRFALGIPLSGRLNVTNHTGYLTKVPVREPNRSRLEFHLTPSDETWTIDIRWTLLGEYQSDFRRTLRQSGEQELRSKIRRFLREQIHVETLDNIEYRLLDTGLELRAKAFRIRRKINNELELLQNEFWISGFDLYPHLFENRTGPLLLSTIGEISSSYRIHLPPGTLASLPSSYQSGCGPVKYKLSFQYLDRVIDVEESVSINDLSVDSSLFQEFTHFLNQYSVNHFWSILISRQ